MRQRRGRSPNKYIVASLYHVNRFKTTGHHPKSSPNKGSEPAHLKLEGESGRTFREHQAFQIKGRTYRLRNGGVIPPEGEIIVEAMLDQ